MTAPIATGGAGASPALAAFEALTATPSASGTPSTPNTDPLAVRFAGMLARIVGAPGTQAKDDPTAMVEGALASLESALAESGAAEGAMSAGTSAIRALVAQALQAAPTTSTPTPTPATTNDLAGALAMTPPLVPSTASPTPSAAAPADPATSHSETGTRGAEQQDRRDGDATANPDVSVAGNATPALSADPSVVVRDIAALDPAFRAKLDRVIDRMRDEFGHKVTIVETVRSQVRQDALYEQGRSAPGDVVTWTRNSRHNTGLAADLMVDGSYDNPAGYAHLQQIAAEEGLHTLGAKDPGHLELRGPKVTGFTAQIATAKPSSLTLKPSMAAEAPAVPVKAFERIAHVARVAEVAVTAGVARVARVAAVAVPGTSAPRMVATAPTGSASAAGTSAASRATPVEAAVPSAAPAPVAPQTPSTNSSATPTTASITNALTAENAAGARQQGSTDRRGKSSQDGTAATAPMSADVAPAMAASRPMGGVAPVTGGIAADQASRVAHIDALHEQAAAQPMSSMVLTVDNGSGGTDRIRVDVRGNSVQSTIDVRDQQQAADLASRGNDLARALESRGLEADSLRVRAVGAAGADRPMTESLRGAISAAAGEGRTLASLAADASGSTRRERHDARDHRQQGSQQDTTRQRARQGREESQP